MKHNRTKESYEIIVRRSQYLKTIKKYRDEGRPIYFTDETRVNAELCIGYTWIDKTVK